MVGMKTAFQFFVAGNASSFPPIGLTRTLASVATVLGCTVEDLIDIAYASDQRCFYQRIRIPKKSKRRRGQFRTVYKADQRLALIQKNLSAWLGTSVSFPTCIQGFVQGRSIVHQRNYPPKSATIATW